MASCSQSKKYCCDTLKSKTLIMAFLVVYGINFHGQHTAAQLASACVCSFDALGIFNTSNLYSLSFAGLAEDCQANYTNWIAVYFSVNCSQSISFNILAICN